jgi:superfamily I DNA and RNA helicase
MNETWWVNPDQLDDDQKEVIALPMGNDYLITGPPGSGKTNLLLLKASQLVSSGKPDVLILVFTRTLREFVAAGVSNYTFSPDKIKTFANWTTALLHEDGVTPEMDADFRTQRRKQIAQVADLVTRRQLTDVYEAIIIDEAQDCLIQEIELFRKLGKVLFVAADDRQKIYSSGDAIEQWKKIIPKTFALKFHYRNGRKICAFADAVSKHSALHEPLLKNSQYNEQKNPSSYEVIRCDSLENQVAQAVSAIETELKAYPDELLGIICPRKNELREVIELLKKSSISDFCVFQTHADGGYVPFDRSHRVCVSTIHSAKGLEFRTLHILGADMLKHFANFQRRVAYTAITRAKTTLHIYHSTDLPGFIQNAIASLSKPPGIAKLPDLFSKKTDVG